MRKTILLAGLVALMSSYTAFAGHEGGGGDAVIEEDTLVLRDFVDTSAPTRITNNFAFLRSIPDFDDLIADIAQANVEFASAIIADLGSATFYRFSTSLPVLPSSQTTLPNGRKAEVQLAIRMGSEILIGKDFNRTDSTQYLMVHEALHGILAKNSGSLHHSRVRTIVRYIKENRKNLKKDELNFVLTQNYYSTKRTVDDSAKGAFNRNLDLKSRCDLLTGKVRAMTGPANFSYHQSMIDTLDNYLELGCKANFAKDYTENDLPQITAVIEEIKIASQDEIIQRHIRVNNVFQPDELTLRDFKWYERENIQRQKEYCREHIANTDSVEEKMTKQQNYFELRIKLLTLIKEAFKKFPAIYQSSLLTKFVRAGLLDYWVVAHGEANKDQVYALEWSIRIEESNLKDVAKGRQIQQDGVRGCNEKYPKL